MIRTIVLPVLLLFCPQANAAYPPFAASAVYIKAVLEDQRVTRELGISNPVRSLTFDGSIINIFAGGCVLSVEVKQLIQDGPLPPSPTPSFELVIGKKSCH